MLTTGELVEKVVRTHQGRVEAPRWCQHRIYHQHEAGKQWMQAPVNLHYAY